MKSYTIFFLLMFLAVFISCNNYPRDTYGTLKQVEQGTLMVGYSENPPWVISGEAVPEGIEARLVEAFAADIDAEVEWVRMNEQALLGALERRNLQLVISGLTDKSPWSGKVTFTRPYLEFETRKHVLAVPNGEHRFLHRLESFLNRNKVYLRKLLEENALDKGLRNKVED